MVSPTLLMWGLLPLHYLAKKLSLCSKYLCKVRWRRWWWCSTTTCFETVRCTSCGSYHLKYSSLPIINLIHMNFIMHHMWRYKLELNKRGTNNLCSISRYRKIHNFHSVHCNLLIFLAVAREFHELQLRYSTHLLIQML